MIVIEFFARGMQPRYRQPSAASFGSTRHELERAAGTHNAASLTGRPQAAKPTLCLRVAASRENNAQDAADRGFFPTEPCDNPLHPLCCVPKNACAINRCGSRLA